MFTNGQALKKDEYPKLYAVIGDKYRQPDNNDETTFNLPNKSGRVSIQANDKYPLGTIGGEETHKLTVNEIPAHNHGITDPGHNHTVGGNQGSTRIGSTATGYTNDLYATLSAKTGITINNTGGNQPHNNMQPFISMNYIIRVK